MRRSSLSRRTALKSSGRIKTKKRSKSERERIYGPKGYVEWIHQQPCVGCGWVPSECAHIKTGGMGRKADWSLTVPLCDTHDEGSEGMIGCHVLFHHWGRDTFEQIFLLDLDVEAKATNDRWLSQSGGQPKGVTEK